MVEQFLEEHEEPDFLRTGGIAMENVNLREGPLNQFSHAMEPQLRELGMPTALKKGVIHLIKDHVVCKQGEKLTSEQARILKLFDYRHASFKMNIIASWCKNKDGGANFKMLIGNDELDVDDENVDSDTENEPVNEEN